MILDVAKLGGAPRKPLASRSPWSTAVCIKGTNLSARCQGFAVWREGREDLNVGFMKDKDSVYYKGRMNGIQQTETD